MFNGCPLMNGPHLTAITYMFSNAIEIKKTKKSGEEYRAERHPIESR